MSVGDFFAKLLSKVDAEIDTLHALGLMSMLGLIGHQTYALIVSPLNYSPVGFCTGAASLIAAIGGGRRLRDGPCNSQDGENK